MKLPTSTIKTLAIRGCRAIVIGARLSPMRLGIVVAIVVLSGTALTPLAEGGSRDGSEHTASSSSGRSQPPGQGTLTPSPEMTRLVELLAGTWDLTTTYAPSATAPEGGTGTGQETARPGPGGLSLLFETNSRGPAGPFEGGGIIEWSPDEQVYKLHWVTSLSHVGSYFDGTWVGDDLVFTGTENVMGQAFASQHSITNIQPDAFLYTIEMGPTHDQLRRTITIEYTKHREGTK